jgi:hypothetical protein
MQIVGIWGIYSAGLIIHKQTKEIRLTNSNEWVEFNFTPEEFREICIENGELIIEGRLYDLVKSEVTSTYAKITVIADVEEEILNATITQIQSNKHGWSDMAKYAVELSLSPFTLHPFLAFDCETIDQADILAAFHRNSLSVVYLDTIEFPPVC